MALLWRGLLVAFVSVSCGIVVAKLVIAHAVAGGAPMAQVQLAGAMAGLFAGGVVATVITLLLAFARRR